MQKKRIQQNITETWYTVYLDIIIFNTILLNWQFFS